MRKLRYWLLGFMLVGLLGMPTLAAADVNDFTVTNFVADETLSRNDPQGELHIVEHISVDFSDFNHGILRAIPNHYKSHSLQLRVNKISSETGAATQYSTYGSHGNTVLKIGDPDHTVTGAQEYTIDYTLRNVISFYKDHDELYWDVNGDQWHQQFQHVAVTLNLPEGLNQSRAPVCYTGSIGSAAHDCTITSNGKIIQAQTTQPLAAGQTLTYVAGFQPGYFHVSKWYEVLAENSKLLIEFFVPLLLIGGSSFIYWYVKGRDPKGTGVIVPQYDAPDGLKPLAIGTLIDFKVDNRDITAMIIDLAIRKYLKIIETKHVHKLRKDTLSYKLQLVNADWSQLDELEKQLLGALFTQPTSGATIGISGSKTALYNTAKDLSKGVETQLTTMGYFRSNPLSAGNVIWGATVAAGVLIYFGHKYIGIAGVAGAVIGGIIAVLCRRAAAARTSKGVAAQEHILGLKMYLNVAEKDRLQKLQAPNAAYAANTGEPVKTVELFEKLLPYAMVLGVEKQWAQQFEGLYASPPDWYSGNWSTFNAYYLASSLSDGIGGAVDTAFSPPSSSGSSGFGGGFAGGGGGGGGGGGW